MQLLQKIKSQKKDNLLFYLILLACLFIMVEVAVFIYGNELYLADYHFVADKLKVPWAVLPAVFYFFCMQFLVHASFVFIVWSITKLIAFYLKTSPRLTETMGISLWIMATMVILLANHYFFPNTKFACLTFLVARLGLLKIALMIGLSILLFAVLLAALGALKWMKQYKLPAFCMALMFIILYGRFEYQQTRERIISHATITRPNIILIGVDALRPDFLSFFGAPKRAHFFDDFLEHSTVFAESLTPDARTYPAWVSLLTGQYPKENGVRFDLSATMGFDPRQTLPAILRAQGYQTIFAMDDVRFSNIDETMGFDKLITPPIGFNDFLIGSLNDFPMSNLLVNTWIGRYLFPFSYANRAIYITYEPNTFLDLLNKGLSQTHDKPLFLAVHFCLPHYPYAWAKQSNDHHFLYNYRASILRADLQVQGFFKILKANHLLDHAIVVFLSDHGEALELAGDRVTEQELYVPGVLSTQHRVPQFYPASIKNEPSNRSTGHGTDVLSFTQYHNVLAFRFYGLPGQKAITVPGWVSLLDIKPTVLALLSIEGGPLSGQSLVDYIAGLKTEVKQKKDFFMESDFSPAAVRSVYPETRKILFQGIDYFEINPFTMRLTIKPSMSNLIISSKQYADIDGEWVLALYPQAINGMTAILVNLRTGEWTDDLKTPFAKGAPVLHMLNALKKFYGAEIKNINTL